MKSYFKFLSRNKLYTAIEAFGLSIALAFVMILVSYAFMEYRVGTHQPDAKNLYVPGSGDYLGMTLGTAKEFSLPSRKSRNGPDLAIIIQTRVLWWMVNTSMCRHVP